jgi:hypothetical protein
MEVRNKSVRLIFQRLAGYRTRGILKLYVDLNRCDHGHVTYCDNCNDPRFSRRSEALFSKFSLN